MNSSSSSAAAVRATLEQSLTALRRRRITFSPGGVSTSHSPFENKNPNYSLSPNASTLVTSTATCKSTPVRTTSTEATQNTTSISNSVRTPSSLHTPHSNTSTKTSSSSSSSSSMTMSANHTTFRSNSLKKSLIVGQHDPRNNPQESRRSLQQHFRNQPNSPSNPNPQAYSPTLETNGNWVDIPMTPSTSSYVHWDESLLVTSSPMPSSSSYYSYVSTSSESSSEHVVHSDANHPVHSSPMTSSSSHSSLSSLDDQDPTIGTPVLTTSATRTHKKSNLIVVLDMDECLIHSQFLSSHPNSLILSQYDPYRQYEADRPYQSHPSTDNMDDTWTSKDDSNVSHIPSSWTTPSSTDSFYFSIPNTREVIHVRKRPHLDIFLQQVTSRFETYVFTAAMEEYAKPLLDHLDPHGTMFRKRFYRASCTYDPSLGVYVKDLRNLFEVNDGNSSHSRMEEEEEEEEAEDHSLSSPMNQVLEEDDAEKSEPEATEDEMRFHSNTTRSMVASTHPHEDSMDMDVDMENGILSQSIHSSSPPIPSSSITLTSSNTTTSAFHQEQRIVLVDNNPFSFLANPSNGILVSNFYDDPKDATLEAVWELLLELEETEDVRPFLDAKFGLKDALNEIFLSEDRFQF